MNIKRTIVQVPMDAELKMNSETVAREQGFSSLQEVIRVFLRRLAKREMTIQFVEEERLTPRAERRYAKMIRDMKSGKIKTKSFTSVDEMMKYLHS